MTRASVPSQFPEWQSAKTSAKRYVLLSHPRLHQHATSGSPLLTSSMRAWTNQRRPPGRARVVRIRARSVAPAGDPHVRLDPPVRHHLSNHEATTLRLPRLSHSSIVGVTSLAASSAHRLSRWPCQNGIRRSSDGIRRKASGSRRKVESLCVHGAGHKGPVRAAQRASVAGPRATARC
jgi:hypothetical protein